MNVHTRLSRLNKALHYIAMLFFLSACTGLSSYQDPVFDSSQIKDITLQLEQSGKLFELADADPELSARIASNLSGMGYIVSSDTSTPARHELSIKIGDIQRGSTPPGFSWSSGNSDPRALDFQKADIIPITCILTDTQSPEQTSAELDLDFNAKAFLKTDNSAETHTAQANQLADDISTVCYNLLAGLDAPTFKNQTTNASSTSSSSWFPAISYEIEDAPESAPLTPLKTESNAVSNPTQAVAVEKPAAAVVPTVTPMTATTNASTNAITTPAATVQTKVNRTPAIEAEDNQKLAVPTTSTAEVQARTSEVEQDLKDKSEPVTAHVQGSNKPATFKDTLRKRIIIRNNGTPLIFSFGHERK